MTLLKDLARVKITFQARTLRTILTEGMDMTQSKHDQMLALVERLTGYTPGPWHIEDCETYLDRGMTFYQEVWSDDLDVLVAAEVTRAHNDGGRANMRLIAAAPELLEALTSLLEENERLNAAIKRQAGAAKTLRELTLAEVQHIRDAERKEYIATQTLDSELEANAILTEENATLRTEKHADAEAVSALRGVLAEVVLAFDEHVDLPDKNCSCHINPPCGDCVDYSFAREALSGARETLKGSDQ